MIWDEFLRHFRFCDEEDSGLSDEEQERKEPKNRPKHTRKRIHQAKKNFLEKFKTASKYESKAEVKTGISQLQAYEDKKCSPVFLRQHLSCLNAFIGGIIYVQNYFRQRVLDI